MPIRMTGLASGMDTESIVNALMEAQKAKKTKIENNKTKLEWKQTIWSGLNTKLYNFWKDYAGKVRFQSNFQTKKVSSSNTSKVTATASNSASTGSYKIKVKQLASAQNVTSSKLPQYSSVDKEGNTVMKDVSSSTKLSELGYTVDGSSQIQITAGKKTVSLNVDENTTVGNVVTYLQNAGLNASFDAAQGRFFINSKESGADQKFTITAGTLDQAQQDAQMAVKDAVAYDDLTAAQKSSVMTVFNNLQNSSATDKNETATKSLQSITDAKAKSDATKYYTEQLKESYTSQYIITNADGEESVSAAGIEALKEAKKYKDTDTAEDLLKAAKSLVNSKASADLATAEYKDKIKDAVENGLVADGIRIESKETRDTAVKDAVDAYAASVAGGVAEASDADAQLQKLGLGKIDGTAKAETSAGNGMVVIAAADSAIELNGATLTGSSTTMVVNGLTLNLTGVTDEEVILSVANDTSAVYDTVKEFINQYNSVLTELNKYYNASSARGYDVLTDDQKEAMSDDEVEKWETKIKDSLLRRDTTLNGLIQTMRSTMTSTVITASNGKKYSLANLGITTGKDYKEYGLLHIKGDEDDTDYADSTNTLQKLLDEDPDVVAEVLSGITSALYSKLQEKMKTTSLSSALTFYNDKEMNKQLSQYKDDISDWESKLADLEQRYYNQFTAMEKAMSNLNSQQNYFSSLLGG